MNKSAKYLTNKFGSPVIGDSMILYKAVYLMPSGKLRGSWDGTYEYKIGQKALPRNPCASSTRGVCSSGMHAGSMQFAKNWASGCYVPRGSKKKIVILACQVRIADMVAVGTDGKVRCKQILPLGIVQE